MVYTTRVNAAFGGHFQNSIIMTHKEILQRESSNTDLIHLYKEGLFWKAYEQSAYLFVNSITSYKVKSKYDKKTRQDIIYIGLPQISLERAKEKYTVIRSDDKEITIKPIIANSSIQISFERWKMMNLKTNEPLPIIQTRVNMSDADIANKVRMFNLESKTPMQCMMFLADLKKEING